MVKTKGLLNKRVLVVWHDIVTWGEWVHQHDLPIKGQKPAEIVTVGWVSHIAEDYLVISATMGENNDGTDTVEYNQHISIPLGCIDSYVEF